MSTGLSGPAGSSSSGGMAGQIFQELRAGGSLPAGVGPDEATTAVLCTLLARLELQPARALLDALGPWEPEHGGGWRLRQCRPGRSRSQCPGTLR